MTRVTLFTNILVPTNKSARANIILNDANLKESILPLRARKSRTTSVQVGRLPDSSKRLVKQTEARASFAGAHHGLSLTRTRRYLISSSCSCRLAHNFSPSAELISDKISTSCSLINNILSDIYAI